MTLVEVLVVLFIIVVLLSLIGPWGIRDHPMHVPMARCHSNLHQVSIAFRIWANDHSDLYPWEVSVTNGGARELSFGPQAFTNFQAVQNELGQEPKLVVCPADTRRFAASNFVYFGNTNVSYFLGVTVHAANTNLDLFFAGDRNLLGPSAQHDGIYQLKPADRLKWASGFHTNRYNLCGNILFSDGGVEALSDKELQEAARKPGVAPTTLAFP